MTTWTPNGDRLIVKPHRAPEMTNSGIVLPDIARERPVTGTVLAVGDHCGDIDAGSEVLFSKYGGVEFEDQGEDLVVLRISDVLGHREN